MVRSVPYALLPLLLRRDALSPRVERFAWLGAAAFAEFLVFGGFITMCIGLIVEFS
jgi:hypothetical protein